MLDTKAYSDRAGGLASALKGIYDFESQSRVIAICDRDGERIIRKYFDKAMQILSQAYGYDISVKTVLIDETSRPIKKVPGELEELLKKSKPTHTINLFSHKSDETPFRISLLDIEEKIDTKAIHCPGVTEEMFRRWGPFDVDYSRFKFDAERLIKRVSEFKEFRIITGHKGCYELNLSVGDREWFHDLHVENGDFGNLPAGEIYAAPIENSANGKIMVENRAGEYVLENPLVLTFGDGILEEIEGNKKIVDSIWDDLEGVLNADVIGEFAIGFNKNSDLTAPMIEAEKGGAHIACGTTKKWGAAIDSPQHMDFLIRNAVIYGKKFGEIILIYDRGSIPHIEGVGKIRGIGAARPE